MPCSETCLTAVSVQNESYCSCLETLSVELSLYCHITYYIWGEKAQHFISQLHYSHEMSLCWSHDLIMLHDQFRQVPSSYRLCVQLCLEREGQVQWTAWDTIFHAVFTFLANVVCVHKVILWLIKININRNKMKYKNLKLILFTLAAKVSILVVFKLN